jgi:hypothetical protein
MQSMEFRCEDLAQFGVVLIPPSSPEYGPMVEDIRRREQKPQGFPDIPEEIRKRLIGGISDEGKEWSAVLVNRSNKSIAYLRAEWNFEETNGRSYRHSHGMGSGRQLLTPFGMKDEQYKILSYWNTILPGSKRYLGNGQMAGNNTDVRPARSDEVWKGGIVGGGGGSGSRSSDSRSIKKVTLALDGVFFLSGEFAGPSQSKMWEEVVYDAEERLRVARIARSAHDRGVRAAQILEEIEKVTGPAPRLGDGSRAMQIRNARENPEAYRQFALEQIAQTITSLRTHQGEEATIYSLLQWAEAKVPQFPKL